MYYYFPYFSEISPPIRSFSVRFSAKTMSKSLGISPQNNPWNKHIYGLVNNFRCVIITFNHVFSFVVALTWCYCFPLHAGHKPRPRVTTNTKNSNLWFYIMTHQVIYTLTGEGCFKCGEPGHFSRECPIGASRGRGGGGGGGTLLMENNWK